MSRTTILGVAVAMVAAAAGLTALIGAVGDGPRDGGAIDATALTPLPVEIDIDAIPRGEPVDFGPPPEVPTTGWSPETVEALSTSVELLALGVVPNEQLDQLAATGDARLAWPMADVLRFIQGSESSPAVEGTITELTGIEPELFAPWGSTVNHLMAWDTPVPPEYVDFKRQFYTRVDPRWDVLFEGGEAIDWRLVGWGGVGIDDRPAGSTERCRCIPALDDPPVTDAAGGDWYPDERIVFGVVIDGEARAYPKNIMEVHEMVNDTLGGRRIGMPYCTLCGSAQVYLTDELGDDFDQPVLRTSGLLFRSNKMMYDRSTGSLIDTFTGEATSGSLAEAGVTFEQVSVVTATWAEWKRAHPDTTIVAEDGGRDRSYELDPLGGRDDDGPIFPIGAVDERLPVQEPVLGIRTARGEPIAIHVATARRLVESGQRVEVADVELLLDGDGLRAVRRSDGTDAGAHQSFWFAWSQFWPDTALWPHDFADA